MLLYDLCDIRMGMTAREKRELSEEGGIPAIQLGDLSPEKGVQPEQLERLQLEEVGERYMANAGDVLFRSRSERNTATTLGEDFTEPAVVIAPVIILRPKQELVDPQYLAWAINQPPAQRHFDQYASGTKLRMIPVADLANLDIPVPSMETQRMIVEIDALARHEQQLSKELVDLRKQQIAKILLDRANGSSAH